MAGTTASRAGAAKPREPALIHPPILRRFPEMVRSLGGDPAAILGDFGLFPGDCDFPSRLTCRQWIDIVERAAAVLDCPTFGMMLAERQGGTGMYGRLGEAMRHARNFGEALRYSADHHAAHSLAVRLWLGHTASGNHVFAGHDLLIEGGETRGQAIEQVLLLGHLGARYLTGGRVGARRVHFRHRARAPLAIYRRYFGCEVRFCQNEDGVAFARAALAAPIIDADRAAFREVTDEIQRCFADSRRPLAGVVRSVVMQWLATGDCRIEDVAQALGLHPRTLARRLRAESISFQRVKDEVRCERMDYFLRETELEFGVISEKLGFAEQSVMSRFARARLGASPSELRARKVRRSR